MQTCTYFPLPGGERVWVRVAKQPEIHPLTFVLSPKGRGNRARRMYNQFCNTTLVVVNGQSEG